MTTPTTTQGAPCVRCGSTERYTKDNKCAPCYRAKSRRTHDAQKVIRTQRPVAAPTQEEKITKERYKRVLKLTQELWDIVHEDVKRKHQRSELTHAWMGEKLLEGCPYLQRPFDLYSTKSPWTPVLRLRYPKQGYAQKNAEFVSALWLMLNEKYGATEARKFALLFAGD